MYYAISFKTVCLLKNNPLQLDEPFEVTIDEVVQEKLHLLQLKDGEITEFDVKPEDFGQVRFTIKDLVGGEPRLNASIIRKILAGEGAPAHNAAVIINTAPLLYLIDKADSLMEAAKMVEEALKSGKALQTLQSFVDVANRG